MRGTRSFAWLMAAATALAWLASVVTDAQAQSMTRYFPAAPAGQPQPPRQSGWRITWRVTPKGTYAAGEILVFDSIEFMKGLLPDGREDWIRVLNQLAMVEMYVPYQSGNFYEDVNGQSFDLTELGNDALPAFGSIDARISADRKVVTEVVGDGVRWTDHGQQQNTFRVRRGQALRIWGVFKAGNYSYVMQYDFADDGRISVRVGGTAQNLVSLDTLHGDEMNEAVHLHMGGWRMEFDLGAPAANVIEVVEREVDPETGVGRIATRPFNQRREGGEDWNPDKFTVLSIMNSRTMNRHQPPHAVGYMLKTRSLGRLRDRREDKTYTLHDFWVSRRVPDGRPAPELRYVEVALKTARPQSIEGRSVVIWHQAALQHIPHGEDFGAGGIPGQPSYDRDMGAAIAHYTGFDLVPMSLWHQTPFIVRDRPGVATPGPTPTPAPSPPPNVAPGQPPLTATLRRGDQGPEVQRLQELLVARGYAVEVDGNYGRGTLAAVRAFQEANQLTPADGVAGPRTLARLQGI
jgi:Copper amine oxidase, enzyme domain/Putative peptidoglycan binding domain